MSQSRESPCIYTHVYSHGVAGSVGGDMAVVVAGWVASCFGGTAGFVGLGRASGLSHGRVVLVDSMPSLYLHVG